MDIKVCLPYYLHYEDALPGLMELEACEEHNFVIETAKGYDPGLGRNITVSHENLKMKQTVSLFDYYLFIDSDMIFGVRHALSLLDRNLDVVGAAYSRRGATGFFNAGIWESEYPGWIAEHYKNTKTGLHKADFIGAGFLLVKKDVFSKLEYPWFRRELVRKGEDQVEASEDYGFCLQLKRAGIDLHVDCNVVVPHNTSPTLPKQLQVDMVNFIPPSMDGSIVDISAQLNRWSMKYKLLYDEVQKIREKA